MDEFLFFLGLYRSDVAIDETCLYRAVSEQIFHTQVHHESIKANCINFMRKHKWLYKGNFNFGIETYLRELQNSERWPSLRELEALSILYNLEIEIFFELGQPPTKLSEGKYKLTLVRFSRDRYDLVLNRDDVAVYSIFQSTTYESLYKNVLGFGDDVTIAVNTMLHDKDYIKQRRIQHLSGQASNVLNHDKENEAQDKDENSFDIIKKALAQGMPPFPYKIAKSLDPYIYRNVEFDVWNERKKEMESKELIPVLSPGVKCFVQNGSGDSHYTGYIQDLIAENKASVYIKELCHIEELEVSNLSAIPITANGVNQMRKSGYRKESLKFDDKKYKKKGTRQNWKDTEFCIDQDQLTMSSNGNHQRSILQSPQVDSGYQFGKTEKPRRHFSNAERKSTAREFDTTRKNTPTRPRCFTLDTPRSNNYVSNVQMYSQLDCNTFSVFQNASNANVVSTNVPCQLPAAGIVESGTAEVNVGTYPMGYQTTAQLPPVQQGDTCPSSLGQSTAPVDIPVHAPDLSFAERPYFVPLPSDSAYVAYPSSDAHGVFPPSAVSTPVVYDNGNMAYFAYNTPPQTGMVSSWLLSNGTQVAWPVGPFYPSYQVPLTPPWTSPTYSQPVFSTSDGNQGFLMSPPITYPPPPTYPGATVGSTVLPSHYIPYPEYMF